MVRWVTGALIGLAFVLALAWPLELRNPPTKRDPLPMRRAWGLRVMVHTSAIVVCLVGAGVGAALISRQAKREYREASVRNLRSLVEGEEE